MIKTGLTGLVAGAAVALGSIGYDKRFYPLTTTIPIAVAIYLTNQMMGKPLDKIHDVLNKPGSTARRVLEGLVDEDDTSNLIHEMLTEEYDVL